MELSSLVRNWRRCNFLLLLFRGRNFCSYRTEAGEERKSSVRYLSDGWRGTGVGVRVEWQGWRGVAKEGTDGDSDDKGGEPY